jgi:hypothetical protein
MEEVIWNGNIMKSHSNPDKAQNLFDLTAF